VVESPLHGVINLSVLTVVEADWNLVPFFF
jgi:hypothetical protein